MFLDVLTKPLFRALARLRGGRVFHPRGAAYEATWNQADGGPLDGHDGRQGPSRAVVRVSRGVGLPSALPDVLGVAVKLLDLHGPGHDQDLLFASVLGGRWGNRLLAPGRTFSGRTFSTVLPYAIDGRRTAMVATVAGEPSTATDGPDGATGVEVHVRLLSDGAAVGSVVLGRRLSASVAEDLQFDPWHTGPSVRPLGAWNRLRRPVYVASQQGRGASPMGAGARGARSARDGQLQR